jgi:hypothetical protein
MNRMACQAASTLSLRVTFFTPFDERGNKVRLGLSADHSYPASKHTVGELDGSGWSVSGRPCRGR